MFDLLKNEYKNKFDIICVLYPTAPLRNTKDIDGTIEKLILSKANFQWRSQNLYNYRTKL